MKLGIIGKSAISLAVVLVAVLSVSIFSPALQQIYRQDNGRLHRQLNARMTQVGVAWLSVKAISGVMSVLKTIQVGGGASAIVTASASFHPLGWTSVVANTLDKISDLCFWALQGLLLQKILLTISAWVSLKIIVPISAAVIVFALWNKKYAERIKRTVAGILLITFGMCFAVPLSLEMSTVVEKNVLAGRMDQTIKEMQSASDEVEKGGEVTTGLIRRFFDGIGEFFEGIRKWVDDTIQNMINFLVLFAVTSIAIPIGTLFLVKYLVTVGLRYVGFSWSQKSAERVKPDPGTLPRNDPESQVRNKTPRLS